MAVAITDPTTALSTRELETFAGSRISYSKVRAITRIAGTPRDTDNTALTARDGPGYRFPGCHHTRHLHAHLVQHVPLVAAARNAYPATATPKAAASPGGRKAVPGLGQAFRFYPSAMSATRVATCCGSWANAGEVTAISQTAKRGTGVGWKRPHRLTRSRSRYASKRSLISSGSRSA